MGEPVRTAAVDFDRLDEACVARVKRAGLDGIDVSVTSATFLTTEHVTSAGISLTHLLRSNGLSVLSATWRLAAESSPNVGPGPRPPELERASELMQVLGEFHRPLLTVTPPPVIPRHPGDAVCGYLEALNLTHRALLDLCFNAERHGVGLAPRAPWRGALISPVEVRELVDALSSPCVGVCIDTMELESAGRLDDWLHTLRHRVLALRVTHAASADEPPHPIVGEWNLVIDPSDP